VAALGRQAPLPWLSFLPQAARERFYVELFECIDGAGSLGTLAPVGRLLDEWHATAQVYADPDLAARLRRPLPGDGVPPSRPMLPDRCQSARYRGPSSARMGASRRERPVPLPCVVSSCCPPSVNEDRCHRG
jgi:hypothetical protein